MSTHANSFMKQSNCSGLAASPAVDVFTFVLNTEPGLEQLCLTFLIPVPEIQEKDINMIIIWLKQKAATHNIHSFSYFGKNSCYAGKQTQEEPGDKQEACV